MKPLVLFVDRVHPDFQPELETRGYRIIPFYEGRISSELLAHTLLGFAGAPPSQIHGVVIRSRIPIDRNFLECLPGLRWIARVGSGLENIDQNACKARGVQVFNAPYGLSNSVGEHALGLLLALMNRIVPGDAEVRQGIWNREQNRGDELDGKTVAIWGYGATGSAFARKLRGFDVRIKAYDPYKSIDSDGWVEQVSEDELFQSADVVSMHVPLTSETRGIGDDAFFARFTRPIYFLNTSRGPVVRSRSLLNALSQGRVIGAGLDVLEEEGASFEALSQPSESWPELVKRSNVVFTPHVAGWSVQSKWRMVAHLLEQIDEFRSNHPA